MAKLKVEKAEKQEQAAMRLAEQKHESSMRKKDLEKQMEHGTSTIGRRLPPACCRS